MDIPQDQPDLLNKLSVRGLRHRSPLWRFLNCFMLLLSISAALLAQPAKSSTSSGSTSGKGSGTGSGNSSQSGSGSGQSGGQGGGTAYFETQMLAYGAVNQLSETIANEVCRLPPDSTVILFDQVSFQNLQMWQSFKATAALLGDAYATLLTDDEADALNQPLVKLASGHGPSWAGAAGFGALSGLVGAIAASTTNNPSTFTIQDSTMAVSIAHQVKRCQQAPAMVYYPLFGSYVNADPKKLVTDELDKLNKVRKKAQDIVLRGNNASVSVGGLTISPASASLLGSQTQQFTAASTGGGAAAVNWSILSGPGTISPNGLYTAPASAPNTQTAIIRAVSTTAPNAYATAIVTVGTLATGVTSTDARFLVLQDLNTQYDQLITSLLSSTSQATGNVAGTAPAGITSVVQGADLEDRLTKDTTYLLYADVVAAGGTQIDRKNVLTVLFSGDWISYSGGLVVNVALAKTKENTLIFSDTLRYRTAPGLPFATIGHPKKSVRVESTNAGDNESSLCNQEKPHHFWQSNTACGVLASLSASPLKVTSGTSISGTVTLSGPAPAGGVNVTLYSSGPVTVPTAIIVPAGKTTESFAIGALRVSSISPAHILASVAGITKTVAVRVSPSTP